MPFLKSAPSFEQFVNDVKNLMLESAARASAVFTSAKFQTDTFKDSTGINSGTSSGYTHRGASNYDVIKSVTNTDAIPAMTSASAPAGYVVTPSTEYSVTRGWWAFADDGITNAFNFGGTTGTLKVQIPVAKAFTSCNIKVQTVGRAPYNFTIEASNTGAFSGEEVVLRTVTGETSWTTDVYKNYTWSNVTSYLYYRINITLSGGASGLCEIAEMEYFEDAPASADIRAVTLTLPAAVTQVVMCADVTLNTGSATYYVSTDGGTNWTTVALADLARVISVPSGSQLVPRVVLTGDAELEFLSIAAAA